MRCTADGFEFDRMWMVATQKAPADGSGPAQWVLCSQREQPAMALIDQALAMPGDRGDQWTDDEIAAGPGPYCAGGRLTLSLRTPNPPPPLVVPFRTVAELSPLESTTIAVHKYSVAGVDEGDAAAAWLSSFLGIPVRLFVKHPTQPRELSTKHVPSHSWFSYPPQTAFADGFPLLLLSQESVDDVRSKLAARGDPTNVTTLNFRPNIVVSGCERPFQEDEWLQLRIGDAEFIGASRCIRCMMPSNNPETGESGVEPTKLLMSYRRVDRGRKYQSCFGINMVHRRTGVVVRVADPIVPTQVGVHDGRGIWQLGTEPIVYA
nr:hypothetical protein HK105_001924 [Polyrhizophydium stewartii]